MKNKHLKRFGIISFCILIGLYTYGLNISNKMTINTMSMPVTNKVIVLDAGHRAVKMAELLAIMG